MNSPAVHLVETTLRDGSYEIDFQFTPQDTAFLVNALDRAGVRYIELCHGNGFGIDLWKHYRPKTRAAASDQAHLAAAQAVVQKAALGVILVVGADYVPVGELAVLPRYGVQFVRLAFLPNNLRDPACLEYIDRAKQLGLTTSINLMQTYAMPAKDVAACAREAAHHGLDWFYVVDSAGGMTPDEIQQYVHAIREESGLIVGLHAHNNGGLAVANSLAAVAAGATRVDGTLQGIGRATGNAPTEQLLLALQRLGHETAIDSTAVLQLGDLARGLFAEKGNDPTNFASGTARLHSRYVPALLAYADQHHRHRRDFLIQVGKEAEQQGALACDSFAADLLDRAKQRSSADAAQHPNDKLVVAFAQAITQASALDLSHLAELLFTRARKRRKTSVFQLVLAEDFPFSAALPWESGSHVGVSVGVAASPVEPPWAADRHPDLLLLDDALTAVSWSAPTSACLRHSFRALLADATATMASTLLAQSRTRVWLIGAGLTVQSMIETRLRERAITATAPDGAGPGNSVILAGGSMADWLTPLQSGDDVILLGRGPHARAVVDQARNRGVRVWRPPLGDWIAAAAAAQGALGRRMAPAGAASGPMRPVDTVIAPGQSDVVVDDPLLPTCVVDGAEARSPELALALALAEQHLRTLLAGKGTL
jgi:4-hydroxy-2-oxovalerate aldolase